MDSGASVSCMRDKEFRRAPNKFVRKTDCIVDFETANDSVSADDGIRASIAPWDVDTDYVLMSTSPNLLSLGEKCMKHGFSFVWVAGKHPCFISPGGTYIIVVDIDDVLPVCSPEHEKVLISSVLSNSN